MIGRRPQSPSRIPLIVALTVLSAGGWLLAQVAETQPAATIAVPGPSETQPAASVPTTQPTVREARDLQAREGMISGLIGSKHDFAREGGRGRDLCLPCHTPHLLNVPAPRFDQRPSAMPPLRPYQGLGIELTGWSLLCLGCHDGVTAPDVFNSSHAIEVAGQLGNSRLGTRGLRSHPVGIKYPANAENYHSLAEVEANGLILPDGRIQCTSCHDAHNTNRHAGLLRISNEQSRMCLTCHRL